jgi:uncharacterized repeat protein (TIGR01451 family)
MMYKEEGLVPKKILALSVLALFILMLFPVFMGDTAQGLTSRLLEKDDWSVSGVEAISDEEVVLTGNLTIGNGGRLTLSGSELIINASSKEEFHLLIEAGGRLELENTTVRAMDPLKGFAIDVQGSMATDNSTIGNYTSIRFTDSKATLNHTKLLENDGPAILATGADLSLIACEVVVPSGEGVMMSGSVGRFLSTVLRNAGGTDVIGLNLSASSDLTFTNGGVYDFTTGVSSDSSYIMFNDAVIRGSETGLRQIGGTTDIIDSRIKENDNGISCTNGTTYLGFNEISAQGYGIDLISSNATIESTTMADSGVGIRVNGSHANVMNNTMRYNRIGIFWNSNSSGHVIRNVFLSNTIAIEVHDSLMRIEDSVFTTNDIGLEVFDAYVDVVNTSIGKKVLDPTSTISILWYLDIMVKDPDGNPVPDAQVEVLDAQQHLWTFKTGPDGWVDRVLLKQVDMTKYYNTSFSPYNITAMNGTNKRTEMIELMGSGLLIIQFQGRDLYVSSMTGPTTELKLGQMEQVVGRIVSTEYPLYNVTVQVLIDGVEVKRDLINIAAPMMDYAFQFKATVVGDIRVRIILDPDDLIDEVDEDNNQRSIIITVVEGPGGNLPDLRLYSVDQSDTNPLVGSEVTFSVDVQNQGTADADDVLVRLFIDDKLIDSRTISHIPAGSQQRATFDWDAEMGEHKITIDIDPFDTIEESDETNNIYTDTITVGETTNPFPFDESVLWMCLGTIVVFIVIILALVVAMARKGAKGRTGATARSYGQEPVDRYGVPQYSEGSSIRAVPASITPRTTRPSVASYQQQGAVCKRCGSSDIKYYDDGHKQCKHCRKIFF